MHDHCDWPGNRPELATSDWAQGHWPRLVQGWPRQNHCQAARDLSTGSHGWQLSGPSWPKILALHGIVSHKDHPSHTHSCIYLYSLLPGWVKPFYREPPVATAVDLAGWESWHSVASLVIRTIPWVDKNCGFSLSHTQINSKHWFTSFLQLLP